MNLFFILFLILPILSFIGVFLLTDSLIFGVIAVIIIDLIFTVLFVRRQQEYKS